MILLKTMFVRFFFFSFLFFIGFQFAQAQTCPLMDVYSHLDLKDVTFSYQQLVPTIQSQLVPKMENHPDEPPFMNGHPEHLRFVFGDRESSNNFRTDEPQLLIFPISRYRSLFIENELKEFNSIISLINSILQEQKVTPEQDIPILPTVEAYQVFHLQERFLEFKGGKGVRFLSMYAQDPPPLTNDRLFYTFQGLTNDGKYYVALYYPVTTLKLPDSLNEIGETIIPVLQEKEKYQRYLTKGITILSRLKDGEFKPDLKKIDEIIQSLKIGNE